MHLGLSLSLPGRAVAASGTGGGVAWMWSTGSLNTAGVVQNSLSFNSNPWMWLTGTLGAGGFVQNSRSF